jgi:hypothetical protein
VVHHTVELVKIIEVPEELPCIFGCQVSELYIGI